MSVEEIVEAQAEIMEKMSPELLILLKKHGQEKMKKKNVPRSDEAVSSQVDNIPIENHLIKHSDISPHVGKKSGLDNDVLHDLSTTSCSLWNTWCERVEKVRGLRFFSWRGLLLQMNLRVRLDICSCSRFRFFPRIYRPVAADTSIFGVEINLTQEQDSAGLENGEIPAANRRS